MSDTPEVTGVPAGTEPKTSEGTAAVVPSSPAGEQKQPGRQGDTVPPGDKKAVEGYDEPLALDTPILMPEGDGTFREVPIGSMADAYRERPTDEQREILNLYDRAFVKGEPAAVKEWVDRHMPQTPEAGDQPPEGAAGEVIQRLQERIDSLEGQVRRVTPVVTQITDQAELIRVGAKIKAGEKDFPFLAKAPNAAGMIVQGRRRLLNMASAQGMIKDFSPEKHPEIMAQIDKRVMEQTEGMLRKLVEAIGGTAPPGAPSPRVLDDQGRPTPQPAAGATGTPLTHKPPRYQMVPGGGYVDRMAPPPAVPQAPTPVPAYPVAPAPTGSPVGMEGVEQPVGPLTEQSFFDGLKRRVEELSTTL